MKALVDTFLTWGPFGVLLLSLFDSAGLPVPGGVDALVIVLAAVKPETAYYNAGIAVIGSLIGNMVLFFIARKGGQAYLERHSSSPRGQSMRRWSNKYGLLTVFVPALLPIPLPLKIFVLSAGALGVRPLSFFAVIFFSRVPRYFGLAYLGVHFGLDAMTWLKVHVKQMLLLGLVILFLGWALMKVVAWIRSRRSIPGRA